MRKQAVLGILIIFILICITGCEDKIVLYEEYDKIMDVAEEMNAIGKISVKIHTVTEIEYDCLVG